MSTDKIWQTRSTSSVETEQFGVRLGRNLRGGEVIELVSDLGGGKTTFVRGVAAGMGSTDLVASPTFTISRMYHTEDLTLHHYDFYRLHDPGEMAHELYETIHDRHSVTVVEWADIVQGVLPVKRLRIDIKTTGEDTRTVTFHYPESLVYLMDGLI